MASGTIATPEEIANWPAPNFEDPESCGAILIGLTATTLALMVIFVVGRFYGKVILRLALGIDDWIMLVATIFSILVSALVLESVNYGVALHIWDQRPESLGTSGKMAFATDVLYTTPCSLAKISLLFTYLRLFPTRSSKIFCNVLAVFLTLYTVTCTCLMAFQCTPIRAYWAPSVEHHCINPRALYVSLAVVNSISDLLVYLWPAKPLWTLRIPLKQRLGLILMFAVGCAVCVAGVCRMYYIVVYYQSYDLTWNAAIVYAVMMVEMNLGIICGCLSGVKPVLAVLFPRYFTSTYISNPRRETYGHTSRPNRPEFFAFQSLSDSKARDRNFSYGVSIEAANTNKNNLTNSTYTSPSRESAKPETPCNALAVNQVAVISEEGLVRPRSNGDGGSEEWIMEVAPEPVRG